MNTDGMQCGPSTVGFRSLVRLTCFYQIFHNIQMTILAGNMQRRTSITCFCVFTNTTVDAFLHRT